MGGADGESTEKTHGGTEAEEFVLINIRCSNGTKITVRADLKSTVSVFKEVVAQSCDVTADRQKLIYKGRILKDDQPLQSYGLQAEHTVHMVSGFPPSESPSTTASVNAPIGGCTNGGASVGGASPGAASGGVGLGATPFSGSDFNFLGGSGMPRLDQMQRYLAQNSDLLTQRMNMPAVQNLMNNPDLVRTMVMNTPQTRDIIDESPRLAHLLNDPASMRRALKTIRTPEFMRRLTGNTDRGMSNIRSTAQTGSNVSNIGPPQANNNARTPSSAPRTAAVGGLGGRGLPDLGPFGMPDAAQMNQLLSQTMQNVLSNPQHMNQLLNSNPQMRSLLDSNPQMREMMQNPDFLRQLNSPEMMQQMMSFQQSLLPLLNQQQGARGAGQAGGAAGLMNMFGGHGTGVAPNTPAVPPTELYATQLFQLQEMGFFNNDENIRALQATSGNVQAAVERLVNNLGHETEQS